jgi:hypothetical protein
MSSAGRDPVHDVTAAAKHGNAVQPAGIRRNRRDCRYVITRRMPPRYADIVRYMSPSHAARTASAASSHCIMHRHAEALSMPPHDEDVRIGAIRPAGRTSLTGLERFGTLLRK